MPKRNKHEIFFLSCKENYSNIDFKRNACPLLQNHKKEELSQWLRSWKQVGVLQQLRGSQLNKRAILRRCIRKFKRQGEIGAARRWRT
jgi:hypothetical protein